MGMRYFGDDAMLLLIEEMEEVYQILSARNRQGDVKWRSVSTEDLDVDSEILATIAQYLEYGHFNR